MDSKATLRAAIPGVVPLVGLLVGLLCGAGAAQAQAQAPESDPAQIRFEAGLIAAEAGRQDLAIAEFRALLALAPTPRVKLELARSLLLHGEAAEALALFRAVHDDPQTPQIVKRNILPYLEAAELRLLRVRYGLRLTSDSNPFQSPEGGTITFNGAPFEYQAPARKTAYGAAPWLSVERLWPGEILTKAHLSAEAFEDSDLASGRAEFVLGKALGGGVFLQAALEAHVEKESHVFLPSVEAWRRFDLSETARLGFGSQIGWLETPREPGASGAIFRPYVMGDWTFLPNATLFARASLERRESRDAFFALAAPHMTLGLSFEAGGFEATPQITLRRSVFGADHPLLGERRKDLLWRPMLTLAHERVAWGGFKPELSVFYERRKSNLALEDYDQFGASLNFRRVY